MLRKLNQPLIDRFLFLYKFVQSPSSIGSITPSSSVLAKKMMGNLPWDSIDAIVELGAGTGVFTRYIFKHKKPSCKAIIIEKDVQLLESLIATYPLFHFDCDAEKLDRVLQELNIPEVDCIISGLPFAVFSSKLRKRILLAIERSLKPGGQFIAFQYTLQMKNTLEQCFDEMNLSFVPFNLPPAFVYHCKK